MIRLSLLLVIGLVTVSIALGSGGGLADASHTFIRFPWTYGTQGYITQGYNGLTHQGRDEFALDIDIQFAGVNGDVRAAATGIVVNLATNSACDPNGEYGNFVQIKSTDATGVNRYELYAHLSVVSVSSNQLVYQGQKVGVEGDSGYTINCGDHLHFRWTSTPGCGDINCAIRPEPMSGVGSFAEGQTWISDNSDRPPLIEGMLIKGTGPNIYVVDNGKKRLITSVSAYNSCGYNINNEFREEVLVSDTALSLMTNGTNVSGRPCPYTLMRSSPSSPDIYVVLKGIKRRIASVDIFNSCGYNSALIVVGPLPTGTGTDLTSPPCPYVRWPWHSDSVIEGVLVKGTGDAMYAVDGSGKHHITSPGAFAACGYIGNDVITIGDGALGLIPTSSSISGQPCPNTLVQPSGTPDLYVIENLVKRYITSMNVYLACGYNEQVTANPSGTGTSLERPPCPYTRN